MVAYERKTGPGLAYILCDICGRKIHQKDAVLITDKWNTHYGLLVCKHDVDKTNEQNRPFIVRELQVQNPKLLRSERPDVLVTNPNSNTVPGPIQQGSATMNSLTNTVVLTWLGPQNQGSDPILGYKITRAIPQDAYFLTISDIITSNGDATPTYYEDIDNVTLQPAIYYIYAVNKNGIGAISSPIYFPNLQPSLLPINYSWLLCSQDNTILTTSQGALIQVHN